MKRITPPRLRQPLSIYARWVRLRAERLNLRRPRRDRADWFRAVFVDRIVSRPTN